MTYCRKISVNDTCRTRSWWKNKYSNREKNFTDFNYGVAFTTTCEERKQLQEKDISSYISRKMGHYLNKCDKVQIVKIFNKKGSSFWC